MRRIPIATRRNDDYHPPLPTHAVVISQAARIGGEFVVIKAQLVREVGGYNEAAVASLIIFRTEGRDTPHATANGWWPATYDDIADRLGLSPDQVRRALTRLVEDGHVERLKLKLGGVSDHTYSYRLVREDRQNDVAISPDQDVANPPDLPSMKKLKTSTPTPGVDRFDEFWTAYPRKVSKGDARSAWGNALKLASAEDIIAGLIRLRPSLLDAEDPKFIPYPATWLNKRRWDDETPPPRKPTGKPAERPQINAQNAWEYR